MISTNGDNVTINLKQIIIIVYNILGAKKNILDLSSPQGKQDCICIVLVSVDILLILIISLKSEIDNNSNAFSEW